MLLIYNKIFIKTDQPFNILQKKLTDIKFCICEINNRIKYLEDILNNSECFYDYFEDISNKKIQKGQNF